MAGEKAARGAAVNPVTVRNEIEPLLSELIRELAAQGRTTERAIYARIRMSLRAAGNPCDLARPFHDLSTMAAVAPGRSDATGDANILLVRILEKARQLAVETEESPVVH